MKKLLTLTLLIAAMGMSFTSCTSDEETPDPVDIRDQAEGSYTGTLESASGTSSISFTVSKGSATDALAINWNGTIIKATKVSEANNSIVFDIETFNSGSSRFVGYDGITLGGTKYNGAYFGEDKKFVFYTELFINGTSQGILRFEGNKI